METTNGNEIRVVSTDFYQTIELSGTNTDLNRNISGAVVCEGYINPTRYVGTALSQLANLFQTYEFRKFNVCVVSSLAANVAGQLIGCTDTNPTFTPGISSYQSALRQLKAHKSARIWKAIDNVDIPLALNPKKVFYCDQSGLDIRVNNQGVFYIAILAPIRSSLVNEQGVEGWGGQVASVWLDYEIVFRNIRVTENLAISYDPVASFEHANSPPPGQDFSGVPYYLLFGEGSEPTTQAGMFIPVNDSAVIGVARGVVYYYGSGTFVSSEGARRFYWIFGDLASAQKMDPTDVIDISRGTGPSFLLTARTLPVGPAVRKRTGALGNQQVQLTQVQQSGEYFPLASPIQESTVRHGCYLVRYQASHAQTDTDPTVMVEDSDGVPVGAGDELIYKEVVPAAFAEFFGLTSVQFENLFGFSVTSKRFIGLLLRLTGAAVLVLSQVGTAVRTVLSIKRAWNESEERILQRLADTNPISKSGAPALPPQMQALAQKTHPGCTYVYFNHWVTPEKDKPNWRQKAALKV